MSCTSQHEPLPLTHKLVQMEEALLKAEVDGCCSVECVTELRSLRHLDQIVDSAASSIVVVAFYSRVRRPHLSCVHFLQHAAFPLLSCEFISNCYFLVSPSWFPLKSD